MAMSKCQRAKVKITVDRTHRQANKSHKQSRASCWNIANFRQAKNMEPYAGSVGSDPIINTPIRNPSQTHTKKYIIL